MKVEDDPAQGLSEAIKSRPGIIFIESVSRTIQRRDSDAIGIPSLYSKARRSPASSSAVVSEVQFGTEKKFTNDKR